MLLTDLAFPPSWREGARRLAIALKEHDRFLVCAHRRPDGDALSSMACAGRLLKALGKSFFLYLADGVPPHLSFLPLPCVPRTVLSHLPFVPETLLALDCGDVSRFEPPLVEHLSQEPLPVINIDHHQGSGMGDIATIVCPEAASTTQVLASVVNECGVPWTREMAEALALGLITDTGGFKHANCTPEVFALASFLSLQGADIHALREQIDKTWTKERMRLWGRLANKLEILEGGAFALCCVTMEDFCSTSTSYPDIDELAAHLLKIRGVNVGATLREVSDRSCKLSLRSCAANVYEIARRLGGGGHILAAGAFMDMTLERAKESVLTAVRESKIEPLP